MMKKNLLMMLMALLALPMMADKLWDNGRLRVSDNQRFLQFENGKPFFWLGETAWLMPERPRRGGILPEDLS